MASLDHPFIIKLRGTFKTSVFLCMLLELCLGGDFFSTSPMYQLSNASV